MGRKRQLCYSSSLWGPEPVLLPLAAFQSCLFVAYRILSGVYNFIKSGEAERNEVYPILSGLEVLHWLKAWILKCVSVNTLKSDGFVLCVCFCTLFYSMTMFWLIKFVSVFHQCKLCLCTLPCKRKKKKVTVYVYFCCYWCYLSIFSWYVLEQIRLSNCLLAHFPVCKNRFIENMSLKICYQINYWGREKCKPANEGDGLAKTLLRVWTRDFCKFLKSTSTFLKCFTMWL